jgi:superfamily II DNA or RNA helicase
MKAKPHQQIALNNTTQAISINPNDTKIRLVAPTGTGKTFIQVQLLDWQITNNPYSKVHLILAPRLVLINQLMKEYRTLLNNNARFINFSSGTHEPDAKLMKQLFGNNWAEKSTTIIPELKQEFEKASATNQHFVIFSTYHSAHKLINHFYFDTLIADESQFCVAENFNDTIKQIDSRVKAFFTATEKYTLSENGRGLNNTQTFGNIVYKLTPNDAINQQLIVPPKLHVMYAHTDNKDKSIVSQIIEITKKQIELTNMPFNKILYAMNGTNSVKTINDQHLKIKDQFPNHTLFTITTKEGSKIDNKTVKRTEFLQQLKESENALIFHYDILAEGIDIDGITGVVLLRGMEQSKLLQTIGRSVRLYKPNPSLKQFALISVPVINNDDENKTFIKDIIFKMKNYGYDISSENIIVTDMPNHIPDDEPVNDAYKKDNTNRSTGFINNVFHQLDEDEAQQELEIKKDNIKDFITHNGLLNTLSKILTNQL